MGEKVGGGRIKLKRKRKIRKSLSIICKLVRVDGVFFIIQGQGVIKINQLFYYNVWQVKAQEKRDLRRARFARKSVHGDSLQLLNLKGFVSFQ